MQKNNTYEYLIQVHFQQNVAKFSLEVPKVLFDILKQVKRDQFTFQ